LAAFPGSGPWFNVIARIPLVRTALLLDDRDLCRLLLREAEHHARFEQRPLDTAPSGAMRCLAQLRQQVDAMHLPAAGASALTEAELRVLRLLPTNLSLGEMATRLFVSRNTVKSHAASIYRKLGASNRSQAVEAAAAAGLVEPT
jgi:LuxR family maltose regulon positive regulatory protein